MNYTYMYISKQVLFTLVLQLFCNWMELTNFPHKAKIQIVVIQAYVV